MTKSQGKTSVHSKKKPRSPANRLFRIFQILFVLIAIMAAGTSIAVLGVYFDISKDLPRISNLLADYRPPLITTIYSDDNRKIAEFFKERRTVISLDEMPLMLKQAFVAAEDSRFFEHHGIDYQSIIRAFLKNIEAKTIVQGGSTITQQVTKAFFLTPEKSYTRKIKEAILSYRIDNAFGKEEILFLYLNQIYLGHGAYGVQAAAENYFGKSVSDLNLAECAILAGLPQAPSRDSPFRHPERAKERQIYVLNRMVAERYISNIQAAEAIDTQLEIKDRRNWYIEEVPFYTEYVRQYIESKYGADVLYTGGLRIYTAVNIEMQKIALQEIGKGLSALDKRQGYRGPIRHLATKEIEAYLEKAQLLLEESVPQEGQTLEGIVIAVDDGQGSVTIGMGKAIGMIDIKDMRWARRPDPNVASYETRLKHPSGAVKVGDVILVRIKIKKITEPWELALEQIPKAQSALLSLETGTGHVKAMVGGSDFKRSQFNRAIQSRRQPGSAFKPLIYAAAIDKGYTPATILIDSPIVYEDVERNFEWKPQNYDEKFQGPTLLRNALEHSRNLIAIKLLKGIGIDYAIDYAQKLGVTSPLHRNLSIALGSSGISLLEIVKAYSVFANAGYLIEPVFIVKIIDRDGKVLEEAAPAHKKIIEDSTAYIITSLLEGAVQQGTGQRVRALNRPVAGKTGTTNNLYDAWFIGYTPGYITGTWVGFDEERTLGKGETGSRTASPIWLGFMNRMLADKPIRFFQVPEGVVFAKIDARTGLLPILGSKKVILECFKEGTVPTEQTKDPNAVTSLEDFYKKTI
ncbi:MAG: PBP1A family penicillin-binding protein [Proteobacteria bacterium]|nr:PBP1A family penicillin-binding protein [Pseudomonadota bacterium]